MSIVSKLKPKFWDYHDVAAGPHGHLFNFRRMWKLAVFLTAGVALLPLISLAVVDYQVTQKAIISEILLRDAQYSFNSCCQDLVRDAVGFLFLPPSSSL